jgi:uncharacterized protein (DUF1501 family)
MNRRSFVRAGIAGIGSLSLSQLLRRRATAAEKPIPERTAVVLVWLPGGPSHLETYDPKPHAPSEYRGPFSPIATSTPGVHVCELLPLHAKVADKFSILRSMVHTGFCHQQGTQQLLTGHPVLELKQKPDHPDLLAVTNRLRFDSTRAIPNYIGVPQVNYSGSAYLGPTYEPFAVHGDPNDPNFSVPNIGVSDQTQLGRIGERIDLRKKFDRLRREVDVAATMEALDMFELQAWNMLTSPAARAAFDLNRENQKTRERYGRNRWGQQCLLARRLVEAGVELVTVQLAGDLCGRVGNWDDHAVNHNVFEGMKYRAPFFDQAVSSLIEDVYARGLDKKVMIVVSGEFGRTPKISYVASSGKGVASADAGVVQPGRDHWPRATSILFSGGGIATGQAIGATDARGEDVVDRRVGRGDFLATMYRHLGIDPDGVAFRDFAGRPIPILPEGLPIPELLA